MAKGKKSGGRNFPPGESGNPKGRPPLPDDVRVALDSARGEYDRIVARFIVMPAEELELIARAKTTPALERAVAKTLYVAGRSGDPRRMAAILDRFAGRPTQKAPAPSEERPPASFIDLVLEAEKDGDDGDD